MAQKKSTRFDYPELGYDLICLQGYMYLGERFEHPEPLAISKDKLEFGRYELVPGESYLTKIGTPKGSAMWKCLHMLPGNSLLFIGVLSKTDHGGKVLLFNPCFEKQEKTYGKNLFGYIDMVGGAYKNLYIAFNLIKGQTPDEDELHITTTSIAARVFRSVLEFDHNCYQENFSG